MAQTRVRTNAKRAEAEIEEESTNDYAADNVSSDNEDDNDEDDDEEEEDEEDKALDAQLKGLEEDLANVPFEQLAKVRAKLGQLRTLKRRRVEAKEIVNDGGKHRPKEMSSKKPVPYLRQVVPNTAKHSRDPRFDPLVGKLNKEAFEKAYGFIEEYQQSEMKTIQANLKQEKDPERRLELQRLLTKMQQTQKTRQKERARQQAHRERNKIERELVKLGKKPFYPKKSDQKKSDLVKAYEQLKGKGDNQVDKVIEKRRRKVAQKDHKFMPYQRRSANDQ